MVGYSFHYKNKKEDGSEERSDPPWLGLLLRSKFFGACEHHRDLRKSEMNIYCIDCNRCMCSHCLSSGHRLHRLLQIRRYVYQDVIRIHDIQKMLDCSKVQPYIVNSAKVVLLNPRRQSKTSKVSTGGTACEICGRTVMEHYRYCSIACKVSMVEEASIVSAPNNDDYSPCLSWPQDSSEQNRDGDDVSPQIKIRRRKGYPCRAPSF